MTVCDQDRIGLELPFSSCCSNTYPTYEWYTLWSTLYCPVERERAHLGRFLRSFLKYFIVGFLNGARERNGMGNYFCSFPFSNTTIVEKLRTKGQITLYKTKTGLKLDSHMCRLPRLQLLQSPQIVVVGRPDYTARVSDVFCQKLSFSLRTTTGSCSSDRKRRRCILSS